jgi:hypothetical protein
MADLDGDKKVEETITKTTTKNIVLADGTYSSVTSTETTGGGSHSANDDAMPHLRKLVSSGDILLGTVACVCLTKMALKTDKDTNRLTTGVLMTTAGVGKLAEAKRAGRIGVHADCLDRLSQCCRILLDPNVRAKMSDIFLKSCQDAYSTLVAKQKAIKTKASELDRKGRASQADDLIQFRQLRAQVREEAIYHVYILFLFQFL